MSLKSNDETRFVEWITIAGARAQLFVFQFKIKLFDVSQGIPTRVVCFQIQGDTFSEDIKLLPLLGKRQF